MPRHSKNNTASSVFTYHEVNSLNYGTKKQRLGRDSFRAFNACFLCLQVARDPVACQSGHLACKECLYESILTQKQEIQRQQRLAAQRQKENDEQKVLEDEEAQLAILANFERTQTSVLPDDRRHSIAQSAESTNKSSPTGSRETSKDPNTPSGSSPAIESSPQLHAGTKRKFELNKEERQRAIDKEKEEALRKINEARSEEAKPKLPSFWLPSLTPNAGKSDEKDRQEKEQAVCVAGAPHPVTIKSLIPVKFTNEDEKSNHPICPACMKGLNNGMKISVFRKCGHVICNKCIDSFVKKSQVCYVCEKKFKDKDIIDISAEGTGFASNSNQLEAKRFGLSFQ
ncbi:hypothetical protein K450DRAFT_249230 [Umbelopsis ramanniana AG]|uniref:RING-type domain-containing protein n=1 Tax=Umbelopsis ramanniana AG TaxID=1314678 RepID=A0AAD5E704_UMBRA|nr:uncharacterized protein K450DRAFT_249230 [Umbelopsis ramanniana AG]KAI8577959.1 hypothetical protein K450DRAFT_249230 [Umbelopsis ramanniana AG]